MPGCRPCSDKKAWHVARPLDLVAFCLYPFHDRKPFADFDNLMAQPPAAQDLAQDELAVLPTIFRVLDADGVSRFTIGKVAQEILQLRIVAPSVEIEWFFQVRRVCDQTEPGALITELPIIVGVDLQANAHFCGAGAAAIQQGAPRRTAEAGVGFEVHLGVAIYLEGDIQPAERTIRHDDLEGADRPAILRGNVHGREIGNGLCESGAVGVEFLHEGAHFLGLAHPLQALRMGGGGDE